jgi:hypothetical protein
MVVEDGAYHGEAVVPFTREGGEVYLAFSVELGITITSSVGQSQEMAGIRIAGAVLDVKQATVLRTQYRVENHLTTAQRVTIEHPIWVGAEVVEVRAPDARTAEYYRWTVACPARQATTFTVAERRFDWHSSQLLDISYERLQEFLRRTWLDQETTARIRTLLEERAAVARNEEEIGGMQAERAEIYMREEQLRGNMRALGTAGDEGELRRQVVGELAASEARLGAIHARIATLKEENERRRAAIDAELAGLHVSSPATDS